jgi:hypothetical protein
MKLNARLGRVKKKRKIQIKKAGLKWGMRRNEPSRVSPLPHRMLKMVLSFYAADPPHPFRLGNPGTVTVPTIRTAVPVP